MTLGTLVLFVEYTRRLFFPLLMFAEQIQFLQRAFASADRVFGILSTESTVADPPGTAGPPAPRLEDARLRPRHLRLRRGLPRPRGRLLHGAPGRDGGAGRPLRRRQDDGDARSCFASTSRPRDAIPLDGVDIRRYSLRAWRDAIGLVLQDIHLFPGTVGDNLRVFTDDDPRRAARRSAVRALGRRGDPRPPSRTDWPPIWPRGGRTSPWASGSSISFARALVRDPQILVLDEATSSVDPGTERKLQESVERLRRGRTSLVVAHRLSTITAADRILVLQRGRLVEEGTHRELYERGGTLPRPLRPAVRGRGGGADDGPGRPRSRRQTRRPPATPPRAPADVGQDPPGSGATGGRTADSSSSSSSSRSSRARSPSPTRWSSSWCSTIWPGPPRRPGGKIPEPAVRRVLLILGAHRHRPVRGRVLPVASAPG